MVKFPRLYNGIPIARTLGFPQPPDFPNQKLFQLDLLHCNFPPDFWIQFSFPSVGGSRDQGCTAVKPSTSKLATSIPKYAFSFKSTFKLFFYLYIHLDGAASRTSSSSAQKPLRNSSRKTDRSRSTRLEHTQACHQSFSLPPV